MATTSLPLKLLVDKKSNRVLFAEASKEFVDLLFHILSLPTGTFVSLLTKEGRVGSLDNLYGSIENLLRLPNSAASSSSREKLGFVKGAVTYKVMDNLVVKPMSTISSITQLFATFNVKDIRDLEEKEINFGMNEAVKLIKASLKSKTVLTDVFLKRRVRPKD